MAASRPKKNVFFQSGRATSGPGIAAPQLDRIFDAFVTTKPEGLGMGLSISRSIVERHSGRLWAESQPGRGATFLFTLPAREGAASRPGEGLT